MPADVRDFPLRWMVLLSIVALPLGCKSEKAGDKAAALELTQDIAEQEESILARRDALVSARGRIRTQREDLAKRRREAVADGRDTADLDVEAKQLDDKSRELEEKLRDVGDKEREVARERRQWLQSVAAAGGEQAALAAREARLAERESDLSRREARLAGREKGLAAREKTLAEREAQTCGAAATSTTIIKTVPSAGAKYSRKDVAPLLKSARSQMGKKGILADDLPEPAKGLEREANKALGDGDFGRAWLAAQQLRSTVKSLQIGRSFIAAKIDRLNRLIAGKKLSSKKRRQVEKLFVEATGDYGDGKFQSANRRLNQIYTAIR